MAESGDGHCDSVGVAVVYALLIADRAAGMYDCCHTSFAGNLDHKSHFRNPAKDNLNNLD